MDYPRFDLHCHSYVWELRLEERVIKSGVELGMCALDVLGLVCLAIIEG